MPKGHFEPYASKSSITSFAPQESAGQPAKGPFQTLGEDKRPTTGWLNKTYNKLGSYLHASWPFSKKESKFDFPKIRNYLNQVLNELEPFVRTSFTNTIAEIVTIKCILCGTEVKANYHGVIKASEIFCLNPDCECRITLIDKEKLLFDFDITPTECINCKNEILLPTDKLKNEFEFQCTNCKTDYLICGHNFSYKIKE